MSSEKRRHPRLERPIEGRWDGASGRRDVRITSLSLGGCFVDGMGTPSVGERLLIELQFEDQPVLPVAGEVVYLSRPQGFGVRFVNLPIHDQRILVAGLRHWGLANPYGDARDQARAHSPREV